MLYAGAHPERLAGLVIVDTGPEHDPRGQIRIRMDAEAHPDPSFASVAEFETLLSHQYVAATPAAIRRMAEHGVRKRDDGRYVLKMDTKLRDFGRAQLSEAELRRLDGELTERLWKACETVPCPTLVIRGAASDILAADIADRMADEVLASGSLAVIARSSHSVMTDNPGDFGKALNAFALGEE